MWTGEEGSEDNEGAGGQTSLVGLGGLGGLQHWMGLMAEHMAQDTARLPFLWPKLSTGNTVTNTATAMENVTLCQFFSLSFCLTK